MKTRARDLMQRAATSRALDPLLGLLTTPSGVGRRGINVVVGDYYGMQLGRTFSSDAEAAEHYFRQGWKLGVVPTPIVHASGPRVSTAAALLLRNDLARIARGGSPRQAWLLSPSRQIQAYDLGPLLNERGGWIAAVTRHLRRDPLTSTIRNGRDDIPWARYLAGCREITGAAAAIVDGGALDLPFYESQLGGRRFLSPYAALDDYLANGELDGRSPHPFFEAEWYEASDRSQVRRGRPVNQFLDFVTRGEQGEASAHFWGHRYLESLGTPAIEGSVLAHFTARAKPRSLTPAASGVAPIAKSDADAVMRRRVADYHHSLGQLDAGGPILRRHLTFAAGASTAGTALVVIDERHLGTAEAVAALSALTAQTIDGMRVIVVEKDDIAREARLSDVVDAHPMMDFVARTAGETLGAVIRRVLQTSTVDGWTVWTPEQTWRPGFLAAAVGAIRASDAAAAAAVGPTTPQPWLRTADALWVGGLTGAGVVFRRDALPEASLDLGSVWWLLIALAASDRPCAVVEGDLVTSRPAYEVTAHEHRAAANSARSRFLATFEKAPTPGTAIVIPTYEDWRMTLHAVRRVLATTGPDVRVAVIDNGSRRPVATILASVFAADARVSIRRMARNTDFALGSNIGASDAAAETVVFLNNDTGVQDGWLPPLVDALEDPDVAGVQPLLLYGDRTVQTAGTIFLGGLSMPQHLLAEAHTIDVGDHVDEYAFSALTAACLAVRHRDLAGLRGFDTAYVNGMEDVDLCLRLTEAGAGSFRVRTDARVVHFESRTKGRHDHHMTNRRWFALRWREALVSRLDDRAVFDRGPVELSDIAFDRDPGSPLWKPQLTLRRRPSLSVDEAEPRLRWALKTSATADVAGDVWGDVFFSEALAEALRRRGQDVVIDRVTAHARRSAEWDDVTLTLRGLTPTLPQPGAVNLLWVISHPDLVTRHELESGFDRVYSAGALWAEHVKDAWGVDVRTLLQATDATLFHPAAGGGETRHGVLFVGRTRGVSRPIVSDTIAAGGEPEVYGDDGWEQFIERRFIKGSGIDNKDVPAAYGAAEIVLNDHWKDMAEQGFFSNRLFDAAATGARVISDVVPGIAEVFGAQVQTYSDLERLGVLLDPAAAAWPTAEELAASAGRIVRDHSFDRRAETLLADALTLRAAKGR